MCVCLLCNGGVYLDAALFYVAILDFLNTQTLKHSVFSCLCVVCVICMLICLAII